MGFATSPKIGSSHQIAATCTPISTQAALSRSSNVTIVAPAASIIARCNASGARRLRVWWSTSAAARMKCAGSISRMSKLSRQRRAHNASAPSRVVVDSVPVRMRSDKAIEISVVVHWLTERAACWCSASQSPIRCEWFRQSATGRRPKYRDKSSIAFVAHFTDDIDRRNRLKRVRFPELTQCF